MWRCAPGSTVSSPSPQYAKAKRHLCIAKGAWRKVKDAGIKPRWVFAHPDLLKAMPDASLHYRGIALLSRKRVQEIAGSVDTWERSPDSARVSDEKAPTMRSRLKEMRYEGDFDIEQLLHDDSAWVQFLNEIFHHALRWRKRSQTRRRLGTPRRRHTWLHQLANLG